MRPLALTPPALAAALFVVGLSGAAHAADAPPTPQEIKSATLEAAALIRRAGAEDLFAPDGADGVIGARHLRSGFRCTFAHDKLNNIRIFTQPFPRGDDISCGTKILDFVETLYITHLPEGATVDQAMTLVMTDIRNVYGDLQPYTGQSMEMSRDPKPGEAAPPKVLTARFVLRDGRKSLFSRVSVTMVDGWMVELRMTGPLDKAMEGDLLGGVEMMTAVDSRTAPVAAPAQ